MQDRKELPVSIRNPMQARKQGIHFVLQEPSVVPNMTVAENIFLYDSGSGNRKMPKFTYANCWKQKRLMALSM